MKTQSKVSLLARVSELEHALNVRDIYLSHAFRSEVMHVTKGGQKLSICGECAAHGGVVLESTRDNSSRWYVVGVYYWEARLNQIRAYPFRHDDKEGQDLRTCYEQVQKHVSDRQTAFYAPRVAEACGVSI